MKKRFGILLVILFIASIGFILFNNSSIKTLKTSNQDLKVKVEKLEKQKNTLDSEKQKLLQDKKTIEDKLNK
ncbi:hypothetical protein [Hathewaya limosa]|uniref:Uncharacterized protein n=1 Tax=Hathewaya limosa TaxID=1536 RepID=A0ABU0JUX6_HATLI|nr:hypothetical protein [Hathewaya limosa]AWZ47970.1 hypothetical protein C3495_03695 [Clostridiaceae bacterium 14S0207]MDQ0480907.1 hypothetical protein [Hathewaya limosa]